jgi:hypothetical protein
MHVSRHNLLGGLLVMGLTPALRPMLMGSSACDDDCIYSRFIAYMSNLLRVSIVLQTAIISFQVGSSVTDEY